MKTQTCTQTQAQAQKTKKQKNQNSQTAKVNELKNCYSEYEKKLIEIEKKIFKENQKKEKHIENILKIFENNPFGNLKKYLEKNDLIINFNVINNYYYEYKNFGYSILLDILINLCYENNDLIAKLFNLVKFLNENGNPINFNRKIINRFDKFSKIHLDSNPCNDYPIFTKFLAFDFNLVKELINYIIETKNVTINEPYWKITMRYKDGGKIEYPYYILDNAIYLKNFEFIKFVFEEKNVKKFNIFSLEFVSNVDDIDIFKYLIDNTKKFNLNLHNFSRENILFALGKKEYAKYFIEYFKKKIKDKEFEKMILEPVSCKNFLNLFTDFSNDLNLLYYLKNEHPHIVEQLINAYPNVLKDAIYSRKFEFFKFLVFNKIKYNKKETIEIIEQELKKVSSDTLDYMELYLMKKIIKEIQ
jgi:hypothetical protein